MTAKDKAYKISMNFDKYGETDNAIQCAIIHVKGIIDCLDRLDFSLEIDYEVKYWQQVLNELNKM